MKKFKNETAVLLQQYQDLCTTNMRRMESVGYSPIARGWTKGTRGLFSRYRSSELAIHVGACACREQQHHTISWAMEVDLLISNAKIVSPCDLATAIGVLPGVKLRLCHDAARPGQSRMTVCCDKRTAFHLRHRFIVPRAYAHDGQLASLIFVGMRPAAVVEGGHHYHHLDTLGAGFRDGAAALPLTPGRGAGRGEATSSRFSATMALPTTPSSSPADGVEVALEKVERAEADGRRIPGIAALYKEFLGERTKTCHQQRFDGGGEDKLGDFWTDRERIEFAITAKGEEKYSSSREAKRGSSRQSRMRSWHDEEAKDEEAEEKDHRNVT